MEVSNTLLNVLIIIFSAGFIVLLGLSILFVFLAVKIMGSVRRVAQRTEDATDSLTTVLKSVAKKVAPMAATTIVGTVLRRAKRRRSHG